MTITYGFYNSLAGDRVYDATDFSSIFNGIIKDGVFMSVGDHLAVKPATGMNVMVGSGRAWFNGTWTNNDADFILAIDPAEVALNRLDSVVLEVNTMQEVRANTIKIIKGVAAASPVATALVKSEGINQYLLATISVPAGVAAIIASHITNKIGLTATPFVSGVLDTMDISTVVAQWESEFDVWFANLVNELDSNQASNLQAQLDVIKTNGWVEETRLATGAVSTGKIANNAISTLKIADDAVTIAKIPNRLRRVIFPVMGDMLSSMSNNNYLGYMIQEKHGGGDVYQAAFQGFIPNDYVSNPNVYLVVGTGFGSIAINKFKMRISMNEGIGDIIESKFDQWWNLQFNRRADEWFNVVVLGPFTLTGAQPNWFVHGQLDMISLDGSVTAVKMAYLEYMADS